MARLKIEDIKKELSDVNWELISDAYLNLDAELIMECPEKHRVNLPLKIWRRRQECPVCKQNPLTGVDFTPIPKKDGKMRILSLDDATHDTGWAIFDGEELVQYGVVTMTHPSSVARIAGMKHWLACSIKSYKPDFVGLEDIQLQQFGPRSSDNIEGVTTYKVLAHLQGVLENFLYENDIRYGIVHTGTWRKDCEIKGKSRADKKMSAQLKIKEWYDISVNPDEAEAICIGKYFVGMELERVPIIRWD